MSDENLWIEISKDQNKYIIGGIYRHPGNKVDASNDDDDDDKSNVSVVDNADQLLVNDVVGSSEQLIEAQRSDPTLASCWEMAKANKGNYVVDHGLLFHYDQVEGQKVCQLCVPE